MLAMQVTSTRPKWFFILLYEATSLHAKLANVNQKREDGEKQFIICWTVENGMLVQYLR